MNEKVKVKFMRYKNVVIMEVLEMPEKYRGKGKLIDSGRISIKSVDAPEITDFILYLRGDTTEFDNNCCVYAYNTTADARKAVKRFSSLIHELNERDAKTTEPTADGEFEIAMAE